MNFQQREFSLAGLPWQGDFSGRGTSAAGELLGGICLHNVSMLASSFYLVFFTVTVLHVLSRTVSRKYKI